MKVKKLKASEVNGILNFDIRFKDNLSFLIGINGSGKTTALKLLLGLVTPSYKFLNKINFKRASLECETDEGETILILAEKKDEELIDLELKINNVSKAKSKIQLFDRRTKFIEEEEELMINRKFEHLKVVKAIQALKTPIFLGLDRRIFQRKLFEDPRREYERRKYQTIRYGRKRHHFSGDPMDMSLIEIQELVNDYIREIAEKQPQLTEEFKSEVLNNSISYYKEGATFNLEGIQEDKLKEKRESLEKAVKDLAIGDFKQRIDSFFIKFEKLNKEVIDFSPNSKDLTNIDRDKFSRLFSQMMMNSWQLRRIDDIIELSQEYQKKIAGLREPLNRLNSILFKFFQESQKKIEVQPNGEFEITLPNSDIATPFELSSGEKQILIMITHLIFYEDRTSPGIFIIDEPELSLHLGWQEIFVNSIREASPNTQFILATHSPTIIGGIDNEQFCIDVN